MDRKHIKKSIRLKIGHRVKKGVRNKFGPILPIILSLFFFSNIFALTQEERISAVKKEIEEMIKAAGAEVGFSFHDLESNILIEINERTVMHAASLMKVPVMIEVFRRIDRGELKLEEPILVYNSFSSLADGSPYSLEPEDDSDPEFYAFIGQRRPLKELIGRMITVSSNLATNVLMELVKAEAVMRTLKEFGIENMKVLRGVEDSKAYALGLNNVTDARDMRLVLEAIVEKKAASPASCAAMIDILRAQKFRSGIPAGLPSEIEVGNKTGSITRIAHDAAIVFPPGRKPFVLVILTRGLEKEEKAERFMASLSRLVYNRLIADK
jgi:beta-lactamase class A